MSSHDEKWLEKSKLELLKQLNDVKSANLIMSRKESQMGKQYFKMAFSSDKKLCNCELYINVSAKDRVQDINSNHLKLKVNDTFEKNEKITISFQPSNVKTLQTELI